MREISYRKIAGAAVLVLIMYFLLAGMANKSFADTAPTAGATADDVAVTDTNQGVSSDTVAALPTIYALKSMSGIVEISSTEAVDEAAVSEHLEENLKATVDAATGTTLTTEEWEKAVATITWDASPVGFDSTNTEDYSFTWSGMIKAGTIVYADDTMTKAAAVPIDTPVVVTFNVTKAASVSESKAPQTGDSFVPGLWIYFIVIGVVTALCALILYRDTNKQ